jgi:hypothetical protein
MAVGITPDTSNENPYITVAEYKNAPTSLSLSTLVVNGNQQAQDAELESVILRASSYMNEYFNQNLVADEYTETQRIRYSASGGYFALHPMNAPIISLSSFQYGQDPNMLYSLGDCSKAWFEGQQIIIPGTQIGFNWTSQGPLGLGGGITSSNWTFTKYTYIAGFANTTLAVANAVGATQITVVDPTGICPGQRYRITDGQTNEWVTVSNSYTYGNAIVTLTSPLIYAHNAGTTFGNMPNALKQACILITSAFIKMRGVGSTTMQYTTQPTNNVADTSRYASEIALALDMVNKYRRIR